MVASWLRGNERMRHDTQSDLVPASDGTKERKDNQRERVICGDYAFQLLVLGIT